MPRENAALKARRLLTEGRLVVKIANERVIAATVRGDSGEVYRVGADPGDWYCSCPALSRCSHIQALMLVTLRPLPLEGPGPDGMEEP